MKALFERGELDYYMLFSNRRCTGVTEEEVRKYIASSTGLPENKIRLYDESELDRLIKRFPKAVDRACLNPGKSPPQIDPTNLAEIIARLANYKGQLDELMEGEKRPPAHRTSPEEKKQTKWTS